MNFKNRLLIGLVKLWNRLQKPHPNPETPKRILIVSTTALGDTLWATPALESLRTSFTNAHVTLLTSSIGEEALRYNPWVDETLILQEPLLFYFFPLWRRLKKKQFDTILLFHASQRLVLPLCALLKAKQILGHEGLYKGLEALLTTRLPVLQEHEIVRRLSLVEAIGAPRVTEKLSFFLQPHEKNPLPPGRWIAIHPGSKDPFKRWSIEHFATAANALRQAGYKILITGSGNERELMETLHQQVPGSMLCNPNGSLRSLALLLAQVELLLSNDTGVVHLACALQIPVLVLYSATDPKLCGPHQAEKGHVIERKPTCDPCLKKRCRRAFCLLQIGAQDVETKALQILKNGKEQ